MVYTIAFILWASTFLYSRACNQKVTWNNGLARDLIFFRFHCKILLRLFQIKSVVWTCFVLQKAHSDSFDRLIFHSVNYSWSCDSAVNFMNTVQLVALMKPAKWERCEHDVNDLFLKNLAFLRITDAAMLYESAEKARASNTTITCSVV